jgi:hypothetical protein
MSEAEESKPFNMVDTTSTALHPRVSSAFPAGYGDIPLLTVDNTVFYVHSTALQHSSAVFETIFENGPREKGDDGSTVPPLKIEADAATLERLLSYIYPSRPSPSIDDVNVIASLFRVAKRYEMEGIMHQLRKVLLEIRIIRNTVIQPLYIKDPFAVLLIAYAFDCPDEGRFALRECLKGKLQSHILGAAEFDVPAEVMAMLLRLREDRLNWFSTKLESIQWPTNNCYNCVRALGESKFKVINQLGKNLEFDVLKSTLLSIGNCYSGHVVATTVPQLQDTLNTWAAEAKEMEEALPTLPRLSHG